MAKKSPDESVVDPTDWMEEYEGQLAIDVYQTPSDIIIKAPIAGVRHEDLDVQITDEFITIKGERHDQSADNVEGYLVQECYWGSFSRTYNLPVAVDSEKAAARYTNGILTVVIPKASKSRSRSIAIEVG